MKKPEKLLKLTKEQDLQILKTVDEYKGFPDKLENALGALILGQHYGWRVLKIIHGPATYKKYEKLLGVEFKKVCPEQTKLSSKNYGYKIAKKMKSFWAVVMGKTKVEGKREFLALPDLSKDEEK